MFILLAVPAPAALAAATFEGLGDLPGGDYAMMIETLEARRLLAATAEMVPGSLGMELRVALNDSNDVAVLVENGHIHVISDGATIAAYTPVFGNPAVRDIRIDGGQSGGDSIRLVSDYSVRFDIVGGTGDDVIHVEGREGALMSGTIHGNNGADVFSVVNASAAVYGDNGDDVCTFVNAGNSFFDGGRGEDTELLL